VFFLKSVDGSASEEGIWVKGVIVGAEPGPVGTPTFYNVKHIAWGRKAGTKTCSRVHLSDIRVAYK
jgi:hypothetical protein